MAVIADTKEGEAPRADVFDLLNIVPYVRKFKTSELVPARSRYRVDKEADWMIRSCVWKTYGD